MRKLSVTLLRNSLSTLGVPLPASHDVCTFLQSLRATTVNVTTPLQELIEGEDKAYGDPLPQHRTTGKRLSVDRYRRLVRSGSPSPALILPSTDRTRSGAPVSPISTRKTANLKVAQVLLGHKSTENTARYLGIEEEQALKGRQAV